MIVRAAALALSIACVAAAHSSQLPDYPFLYMTGTASRDVPPTNAQLRFEINATGVSAESVISTVNSASSSALKILLNGGILSVDIDASAIDKSPRTHWDSSKSRSLPDGYEASRSFSVKVRDLKKFPEMVTRLFALPHATNFHSNFDTADRQIIERALLEEAAKKAREQAASLAASFGMTVKNVRAVSEDVFPELPTHFGFGNEFPMNMPPPMMMAEDREGDLAGLLVPPTVTVVKRVHVIFEIQ